MALTLRRFIIDYFEKLVKRGYGKISVFGKIVTVFMNFKQYSYRPRCLGAKYVEQIIPHHNALPRLCIELFTEFKNPESIGFYGSVFPIDDCVKLQTMLLCYSNGVTALVAREDPDVYTPAPKRFESFSRPFIQRRFADRTVLV